MESHANASLQPAQESNTTLKLITIHRVLSYSSQPPNTASLTLQTMSWGGKDLPNILSTNAYCTYQRTSNKEGPEVVAQEEAQTSSEAVCPGSERQLWCPEPDGGMWCDMLCTPSKTTNTLENDHIFYKCIWYQGGHGSFFCFLAGRGNLYGEQISPQTPKADPELGHQWSSGEWELCTLQRGSQEKPQNSKKGQARFQENAFSIKDIFYLNI